MGCLTTWVHLQHLRTSFSVIHQGHKHALYLHIYTVKERTNDTEMTAVCYLSPSTAWCQNWVAVKLLQNAKKAYIFLTCRRAQFHCFYHVLFFNFFFTLAAISVRRLLAPSPVSLLAAADVTPEDPLRTILVISPVLQPVECLPAVLKEQGWSGFESIYGMWCGAEAQRARVALTINTVCPHSSHLLL